MDLDEIAKRWQAKGSGPGRGSREAARRWDAMAPSFLGQSVPSFEENEILRLAEREGMLGPQSRVLDLGCGAGQYSLALAARVGQVTGLDISEELLAHARQGAARLGLGNTEFIRADWHSQDAPGWDKAFDLSLALLTPAVRDYASFGKFCRSSRGWCVLGNHVARAESLSDRFRAAFGFAPAATAVEDITWAVGALLLQGKRPQLIYVENFWERSSGFEELFAKYMRRLGVCKPVSPESEARLRGFLHAELGGGDTLHERLSATIGVLYWKN